MERKLCHHNKQCLLKTGIKPGPNKEKSFYICADSVNKCQFVLEAKNVKPIHCFKHGGNLVELQFTGTDKSGQLRHYYRCQVSREASKSWCGCNFLSQPCINKENPTPITKHLNGKQSNMNKNLAKPLQQHNISKDNQEPHKKDKAVKELISEVQNMSITEDRPCFLVETIKSSENNISPKSTDSFEDGDCLVSGAMTASQSNSRNCSSRSSARSKSKDTDMSSENNDCFVVGVSTSSLTSSKQSSSTNSAHAKFRGAFISVTDEDNDCFMPERTKTFQNCQQQSQNTCLSKYEDNDCFVATVTTTSHGGSRKCRSTNTDQPQTRDALISSSKNKASKKDCQVTGDYFLADPNKMTQSTYSHNSSSNAIPKSSDKDKHGEKYTEWDEIKCKSNFTLEHHVTGHSRVIYRSLSSKCDWVIQKLSIKHPSQENGVVTIIKQYIQQKYQLQQQLAAKQRMNKQLNLLLLPDKGQRFHDKLEAMQEEIKDLNNRTYKEIVDLLEKPVQEIIPMFKAVGELSTTGKSKTSSTDPSNVKSVQQSNQLSDKDQEKMFSYSTQAKDKIMKQTKILDHVVPLSANVIHQMYAATSQAKTLYGGRMTASRLQEVGSVTSEAIRTLHRQLESCPGATEELDDPRGLNVPLMKHQRQALTWLTWRESQHPPGGILADDMGLGKTLTMIALILKQKQKKMISRKKKEEWLSKEDQLKKVDKRIVRSGATLVIAPASLIHQWHAEILRRCEKDELKVLIYHGPNRERNILKLCENDIVLTTYNIVSKEVGMPEHMKKNKFLQEMPVEDVEDKDERDKSELPNLLRIGWERVILDEAHNIKNHKSLNAISACQLRAGCRWALTGTPIQNDLLDMYSLLRFLRCSPFDEYKVWKKQVDNKTGQGTKRLNLLVRSLLLRRTKNQVDATGKPLVLLPDKNIYNHELLLCEEEKTVYDQLYQQSRSTLVTYLKKQDSGIKTSFGGHNEKQRGFIPASQIQKDDSQQALQSPPTIKAGQILLLLLRLRQCCSHVSLMKETLQDDEVKSDGIDLPLVEKLMELSILDDKPPTLEVPKKSDAVFEITTPSSKIQALITELRNIKLKSKAEEPMKSVVISQWTKMLGIVAKHLDKDGYRYSVIQGNIPAKKRMEIVDEFNTNKKGPEVLLVSLCAGGVGLNLIGGNHLFLLDMHWNPALELQACDRVYRVGQKQNVHIHRFICKNTVEEKILELQKKKMSLAQDVLSGTAVSKSKLTLADLRLLFGV